jgi:hypothetical protein
MKFDHMATLLGLKITGPFEQPGLGNRFNQQTIRPVAQVITWSSTVSEQVSSYANNRAILIRGSGIIAESS